VDEFLRAHHVIVLQNLFHFYVHKVVIRLDMVPNQALHLEKGWEQLPFVLKTNKIYTKAATTNEVTLLAPDWSAHGHLPCAVWTWWLSSRFATTVH
jgi:hypothetical protein